MAEKLKSIAKDFVSQDKIFESKLKEAINDKNLKQTLVLCSNKALWWEKNKGGINPIETMQLAFEIFLEVFDQMGLSEELKTKMAGTVEKKLLAVGKKRMEEIESQPPPKEEKKKEEKIPKKKPKIFGKNMIDSTDKTETKEKIIIEEKDTNVSTEIKEDQKSDEHLDEAEKLRLERERLRIQMRKNQEQKEKEDDSVSDEKSRIDPIDKIKEWLQSDSYFWDLIEKIQKLPKNKMKIIMDPESEGVISDVEIQYGIKRYGNHNIIRIRCKADSGTKYPYNLAVAKIKSGLSKKYVIGSFPDDIPNESDEVISELEKIDFKNQLEWDRLMVLLNNNKYLMKSIKKLQVKNPAPGVNEEIMVPIKIKKDIPNNKIILDTFLSLKVEPSLIFIEIMDEIAEGLYKLREDDSGSVSSSLSAKFESLASKPKDMRGHQFHFLDADESVSIKTCPHCGKPFPNPDADYRRCPHCLGKLK